MSADVKQNDHLTLKAGDLDPDLNKTIEDLTLCTDDFIVYVATDLSVQWRTNDNHVTPKHCGDVLNRVSSLEIRSQFVHDRATLLSIRRQIAEGLARCLDGQPLRSSMTVLKEVELEIKTRNKETSWSWYFSAAYKVTLGCAATLVVGWLARDQFRSVLGSEAFDVLLGALAGAVGALLSVTTRGNRLVMDANAGEKVHRLEGLSRIGTGVGGALFTALAIKSGVVLGGAHFSGSRLALILAFCIVAGASERLVPSLVSSFEKSILPVSDKAELRHDADDTADGKDTAGQQAAKSNESQAFGAPT
ncbi:hypothetical protein SAMN05414139_10835 [Burkholderia sp. D7]|nr:hypothetical protein SAMN05414139_10835 [Burkholderia sp. D7]